jgi:hyperosmotically inducible periplasmic protein
MTATLTFPRIVVASALLIVVGVSARAQQGGVAERVGEALDGTGRAIRRGVEGAYARTQTRVNTMQVLDRVYSRLHWEKMLTTSTLEVESQPGGVTVLRGVAPDARAKVRAVELARDTVGVVQVIDQLSVAPASDPSQPAPVVTPVTRTIP